MSRHTAVFDLQAAIYEKLRKRQVCPRIYDYPPEDAPFPYVVIGQMTAVPYREKISDGERITAEVVIASDYRGFAQAKEILDLTKSALEENLPDPPGWGIDDARFENVIIDRNEGIAMAILKWNYTIMRRD
jgi:hypothetical protein